VTDELEFDPHRRDLQLPLSQRCQGIAELDNTLAHPSDHPIMDIGSIQLLD
jgi:hypothetical protein